MIKKYSGHKNGKFDQSWKDESNKNEWEIEYSHHKKGRSLSSSEDVWNFVTVNIERGINKAKELKEPAGELIDYAGEQIVNLEEPATQLFDSVEGGVESAYNAAAQPIGEAISTLLEDVVETEKSEAK